MKKRKRGKREGAKRESEGCRRGMVTEKRWVGEGGEREEGIKGERGVGRQKGW